LRLRRARGAAVAACFVASARARPPVKFRPSLLSSDESRPRDDPGGGADHVTPVARRQPRFRKWRSLFLRRNIQRVTANRTARLSASPPMFDARLLDSLSRVHPAVPAIVFGPVVVACVWLGLDRGLGVGETIPLFLGGLAIWTLTEYWLHRLVFHWQPRFRGGSRLHFIIHGVHHDHPNDAMRLVMPPAASIPLAALFFGLFWLALGTPHALPLFAAFLSGYLIYDYTHYHLHHHAPTTRLGRRLREQHMRHHFQDHRYGFGVSSPLWDAVFRTLPRRRAKQDR
jgi:sterol desaturase/sphingolipid hydroxylase (fatty acid hydroxylase superfamily)